MRKIVLALAVLAGIAAPANASWVLIPGDTTDRNLHGCGSSWEVCKERAYQRNHPSTTNPIKARATSNVPRFCYSLATGKFTHWGECRVVCDHYGPGGNCRKVAH